MRADSAEHPICEHFLLSDALGLVIFNASILVNTYVKTDLFRSYTIYQK